VSQDFFASLMPYVTGALAGTVLGLAVALGLIALWRWRNAGQPVRHVAPLRQAIPERVRHEVWRRDRGSCVECGSRARLEFDHIIPVSRGGSNTTRNIELRCEPCNRRKGARV
jgi:5-methylcytosine-specific restriction endonuclease McrA